MDKTYWHVLAQLYADEELELSEIAKMMIIATAIGMVEDKKHERRLKVGVNVLDNSALNDSLTLGIIIHHPKGTPISYREIGEMIGRHPQTVAGSVNRMIARGYITKGDFGAAGAIYQVHEDVAPILPAWIMHFTQALIDLRDNAELRELVKKEAREIQFKRGFEVLREELRQKFHRPRKTQKS